MSSDADLLADRRSLRRKLTLWRVLAVLGVIGAAVIGGTSLAGGRANILGTLVGALLMQTLITGLQMMQVNQSWQFVVTGVIVLAAVFADNVRRNRARAI